jgi:hypothetical protein
VDGTTRVDNSMNALAQLVFIGEVVNQAKFAGRAAKCLGYPAEDMDPVEVWGAIQSILIAAGNVSKILWPPRKSSAARGKVLRTSLDIDDRNPLSNRNFRNHFEHYDERLEDWYEKNGPVAHVDYKIDPFDSIWGHNPANFHRGYDPLTKTLSFRGESTDLSVTLSALEEIHQTCRSFTLT